MFSKIQPVRARNAKPAVQQLWEMAHWGSRLLTTPGDYKMYGLYRKGVTRAEASRFLSGPRASVTVWTLNPDSAIFNDKVLFEDNFGGAGLPVPTTLAIIGSHGTGGDRYRLSSSESIASFIKKELGNGLAIKPPDLGGGSGVIIIRDIDGDNIFLGDGSVVGLSEFATNLAESPTTNIIQRRIIQHAAMDALYPNSLNTIRLGTFLYRDGTVEIDFAVLRIGRSGSMIDSYGAGGIGVRINTETGQLAKLGFQKAKFGLDRMDRHPDSNAIFSEKRVPFWNEVLSLCEEFAHQAGKNRYVGWDVAITPDGPMFVEANDTWGPHLAQLGSEGLLTDHFVKRMEAETGIVFDRDRLPPFRPITAIRKFRT